MRLHEITDLSNHPEIAALLRAVRQLDYADKIRVFGSVATGGKIPVDLDIVVDLRPNNLSDTNLSDYTALLSLGRKFYGYFDPFLRFKDRLLARNDSSDRWQVAKSSSPILAKIDSQSIPLSGIN